MARRNKINCVPLQSHKADADKSKSSDACFATNTQKFPSLGLLDRLFLMSDQFSNYRVMLPVPPLLSVLMFLRFGPRGLQNRLVSAHTAFIWVPRLRSLTKLQVLRSSLHQLLNMLAPPVLPVIPTYRQDRRMTSSQLHHVILSGFKPTVFIDRHSSLPSRHALSPRHQYNVECNTHRIVIWKNVDTHRRIPSILRPIRWAARILAALPASACHWTRRKPNPPFLGGSSAYLSNNPTAWVETNVRWYSGSTIT
jgi:hypothetical protein